MTTFTRVFLLLGLLAGAFAPLAAHADYSKRMKKIKPWGYLFPMSTTTGIGHMIKLMP
jgi:hypothetical protein